MALSLGYIGDVTNVGQLTGLDAVSLIRLIVTAASTARAHKKNCRQFAQQLTLIGNLLEQLRVSELKQHRCTREPLELLEDALRRSYTLINNFHDCNYLYLLVMGWNIVRQLRNARAEIGQYLDLIPLITLVDIQRVRERIDNIKGGQHDYTLDEAGKKVEDALSNSGRLLMRTGRLGINDSFLRIFKFKELRSATMDFRHENFIGRGCGDVFKGWIDTSSSKARNTGFPLLKKRTNEGSGTVVAIKRIGYLSGEGFQQLEAEVNFLGSLLHPNVVKLLGYCREKKSILVYEFLHKGSLRNHLFPRAGYHPLSWDLKIKIAVGIARGLAFLHTLHIIHRNIKTDDILLDSNFNPRLSNFGLLKNGATEREFYISQTNDTVEYLAPEYVANGHVSEKIDVYGFGVVLLEILYGKQATEILRIGKISEDVPATSQQNSGDTGRTDQNLDVLCMALPKNYESFVSSCISDHRKLTSLMDAAFHGRYPVRGACLAAQLARSCVACDPASRPSMREVIESLEYIQSIGMSPAEEVSDPCPFFHDINFSFSTTAAYESAPFDADTELSFSKLRVAMLP